MVRQNVEGVKFLRSTKEEQSLNGIEVFSNASIRIYRYSKGFDLPFTYAKGIKKVQSLAIDSIAEHFTTNQIKTWQSGIAKDFVGFVKKCHTTYIIFDAKEEIIGYAILPKAGFLQQFFIHPTQQFKGIGTNLLSIIETEVSNRDDEGKLSLNGNDGSYQFYCKQGYTIIKEHDLDMRGTLIPVKLLEKSLV